MIFTCKYCINNTFYSENSYISTEHKYMKYKIVQIYADNSEKQYCVNKYIRITDNLKYEISQLESVDYLYYIYLHIHPNILNDIVLPKNVVVTFKKPKLIRCSDVKIIDSSMKDIINYSVSITEKFDIFSMSNIMPINFITYKYDNFDITETLFLDFSKDNNIRDQITTILNYQTLTYSELDTDKLEKMITYITHTYNYYLHENIEKNISLKKIKMDLYTILCKICIKQFYLQSVDTLINNDTLSDILYDKTPELWKYDRHYGNPKNVKKIKLTYFEDKKQNDILENVDLDDQYMSFLSYDTLTDCYNSNKCLCLLINTMYSSSCSIITKCNASLITNIDILRSQLSFLQKYNMIDNGLYEDCCINGNIYGNGNYGLPLYINDDHWKISIKFVEEYVSLASCNTSFAFNRSMISIYHMALMQFISSINVIDKNVVSTILNLISTITKIYENPEWNLPNKTNLMHNNKLFYVNIINYFITDCTNINKYFEKACIQNVKRNKFMFDSRKKKLNKSYFANRTKLLKHATKNQDKINSIYKLCNMKECINQLLNLFYNNNGLVTDEMTFIFKNKFKLLENINCNNLLFSVDKSNVNQMSVIDNLLLE